MNTLLDKQLIGDNYLSFTGSDVQPSNEVRDRLKKVAPYFVSFHTTFTKYKRDKFNRLVRETMGSAISEAYYNKELDDRIAIKELLDLSVASREKSESLWKEVKKLKADAINEEDDWNTSKDTAIKRIESSIRQSKHMNIDKAGSYLDALFNKLELYIVYGTLSEAYYNEAMRREKMLKKVNSAIDKRDLKELKSLSSQAKVTELKDTIDSAIKTIEAENKAIAEREKALAEAQKKIDNAKTDEERKKAQDEYNSLLKIGSDASGKVAKILGIPKGAFYIGLGLIIALGGYFAIKKARN